MSNHNIEKRELPQWRKVAQFRRENKSWLRYSGKIALRILSAIEDYPDMNQKRLAELADVSPQQISKIVKGEENLTLKTIAKLSEILGQELISFPSFKYNECNAYSISFIAFKVDVHVQLAPSQTVFIYDTDFDVITKSVSTDYNLLISSPQ